MQIGGPVEPSLARPVAVSRAAPAGPELVPPLKERLLGVLFSPVETFRALDASWGWGAPWLAVAAVGTVKGILRVGLHDLTAIYQVEWNRQLEHMSEQQRRMFLETIRDDSVPAKWGAFIAKGAEVGWPWIGTLLSIVGVGLVMFVAAWMLGGKRDLIRSIVVAAHAKMVMIAGYAVLALATVLGNPAATTSLANAADPITSILAVSALSLVDPIAIWHTVLLGIGLSVGLGVKPRRAALFTIGIQGLSWSMFLAWAAVGAAMSKVG
ncbi:hypothetical protein HY251_15975 [bacterium]|nr:hypothetical protein [bacterium]